MTKFEVGYAMIVDGKKVTRTINVYAENRLMAKLEARKKAPKFKDDFEWVIELKD